MLVYLYMFKASSSKLDLSKEIYKVLLSEYAMDVYSIRLFTSISKCMH